MNNFTIHLKKTLSYICVFLKWLAIAAVTGCVGGAVGAVFHKSVDFATAYRTEHSFIILFLPIAGLLITLMYRAVKMEDNTGTNNVIDAVHSKARVPFLLAPLIFVSTFLTHLFGGSAGREGAALQLGGSIGEQLSHLFKQDEHSRAVVIMCGMSGVFSALFGTPVTATIFAMEVASVGIFHYSGLIPCLISSLCAYAITLLFGNHPVRFAIGAAPQLTPDTVLKIIILGAGAALVSICFCMSIKHCAKYAKKLIKNPYLRSAAGGAVLALLTLLLGTTAYNGAGMDIIEKAISGSAAGYDFLLKIIFTSVTIAAGFKGGEIVPTFFIGSTFGCFFGGLIGLDPGFSAAVGLAALFCGVLNAPISSIFLAIELFGANGLIFYVTACAVSYMLSGYYSLYSSQKIVYSKLSARFVDRDAK